MKDKHKKRIKVGSLVWMTLHECTGCGEVIYITPSRKTCHIKCGEDVYERILSVQIELYNWKGD